MTTAATITVEANGRSVESPAGASISAFLERNGLSLERVVVEHNGRALNRDEARAIVLADGDRLEIVRIVAGG